MAPAVRTAVEKAFGAFRTLKEGKNADYIPALANVDPNLFGIAVMSIDGSAIDVGDSQHPFSIQSIAKVFNLAKLLQDIGPDNVNSKVGVEATGLPFNSIIAVELNKKHMPGNPLVNPGAIASVSLIPASTGPERWEKLISNMNAFAGRTLTVDQEVYKSETATNTRNQAISQLLKAYEVIPGDPLEALDLYTRAGSVAVTARDLAVMGATLANGGVNPVTKKRVIDEKYVPQVLAVMSTAGLYDASGQWAYKVGIPAKSGVGGGIVAIVPGKMAIATFAPPLDEPGNSVKGQRAIESIARDLKLNLFAPNLAAGRAIGGSAQP